MNLAEKLMKLDRGKLTEIPTGTMEIKRLSEMMGEPFIVKCRAIPGERYTELSTQIIGDNGEADYGKVYSTSTLIVVEGIMEPNLKDPELLKHFGCATPKDLAGILFQGGDMQKVSDLITDLSGFGDDTDKKIKN
ncbi:hypothetical protein FYJ45_25000 [Eisenbergiella tayi]|uniref:Phage XkdN-like protein n=1 Tax=Eisenbergiella porci TaxID=2652274 RepID=A0A6N7WL15_9FIRM|nr:hypothetical protein [Eisenbergiella porci]MSS91373.1 hypothetical protein [Eisenbergiella porci]